MAKWQALQAVLVPWLAALSTPILPGNSRHPRG